jgi:hypothetical protein
MRPQRHKADLKYIFFSCSISSDWDTLSVERNTILIRGNLLVNKERSIFINTYYKREKRVERDKMMEI